VSRLVAEHPEVAEVDVNPLLVSPERAVALDCLIVLKESA
jgi:acetyltransferase